MTSQESHFTSLGYHFLISGVVERGLNFANLMSFFFFLKHVRLNFNENVINIYWEVKK